MNFKKLLTYQANKFSKTTIAVRFNLLLSLSIGAFFLYLLCHLYFPLTFWPAIFMFNPLSSNIHIQILQTDLYIFP